MTRLGRFLRSLVALIAFIWRTTFMSRRKEAAMALSTTPPARSSAADAPEAARVPRHAL